MTEQDIDELQQNVAGIDLDDELLQMYEAQARQVLGDDRDLSASIWRIRAKAEAARLLASTNEVRRLRARLAALEGDTLSGWLDRPIGISDIGECEDTFMPAAEFDERVYKQGLRGY